MIAFAVAAAIAVFLLLQAAFRSWRLALVAAATLPVALAGGVLAALVDGQELSLGAIAGLLAVLGLAVRAARAARAPTGDAARAAACRSAPSRSSTPRPTGSRRSLTTAVALALLMLPFVAAGHPPRPRDRAADGRRDPGRPGHLAAAEPVRAARALRPLRRRATGRSSRATARRCASGPASSGWASASRFRPPTTGNGAPVPNGGKAPAPHDGGAPPGVTANEGEERR